MEAIRWNLKENVLTTDYVEIAPEGYCFKGGIKYVLHYYTFRDNWSDNENIKNFKTRKSLEKFYNKLKRGDLENDYFINCAML